MNRQVLLSCRKLKIGYKGKSILPSLTLNLYEGELVCLIGTNGCGKSTLIRTIGGLQDAIGGDIEINGRKLNRMPGAQKARQISFVLTDGIVTNGLTVRQTVMTGRLPYTNMFGTFTAADKEICEACMEKTNISHLADKKTGEISDGERQRTFIAKALAQDTPMILLDEPCAHLDLPNKIEIMRLLHGLAKESGKAILMSSHELELALQAADKLWIMDSDGIKRGTPEDMVLEGRIKETFENPKCLFDAEAGIFRIRRTPSKRISLSANGDNLVRIWTERAIKRIGYEITDEEELLHIDIDDKHRWILSKDGNKQKFGNIEDLLTEL